jgi:hypothetical protein
LLAIGSLRSDIYTASMPSRASPLPQQACYCCIGAFSAHGDPFWRTRTFGDIL